VKFLISLALLLLTASCASKRATSEISIDTAEREVASASNPVACAINATVAGDSYKFELLGADTKNIGLRIIKNNEKPVEMNLTPKKLLLGGYTFEGREYVLLFGWHVEAILMFLAPSGYDFKLRAKNNFWGNTNEFYTFCNR
jgi:hypothetical protein